MREGCAPVVAYPPRFVKFCCSIFDCMNLGNSNNKLCHIDVAVANRCDTNNLQFGEGNATLRRCSEVNVKRAIAHDYSATIPPLEIIAYSATARVYAKRNLSQDSVSALLCAY